MRSWGGVGGVGGGLMTSMRMRLVFSFCFLHLLVLFGGAVRSWGGVGGVITRGAHNDS